MLKRYALGALHMVLGALTGIATAQPVTTVKTFQELNVFLHSYYLQPRPDLVADAIRALSSSAVLSDETTVPPIAGFFSEVFAANPEKLAEWQTLIEEQDERAKNALNLALSISQAGGALQIKDMSASANDLFWGAFFASGKPEYVLKLVDQLKYYDERDDAGLFAAGAAAKWSLASNARQHEKVRSILEGARVTSQGRMRDLIEEVLRKDPGRIQQETMEIVTRQRQAGKWR